MGMKERLINKYYTYRSVAERENVPFIVKLILGFIIVSSCLILFFETTGRESNIATFIDAIWWSFVTMTTVGYGDHYPTTVGGKVIGVLLMFAGITLSGFFTATISSIFVERKIKEGRGLEQIKSSGHLIICGWNQHSVDVLSAVKEHIRDRKFADVVLVGNLGQEMFFDIKERFPALNIRYVRGNYSKDSVLKRANVQEASTVVIFSDESMDPKKADDLTILTTLAIKSENSKVKVIAELNQSENVTHLKRANVDEVILNGEFNGYLLSNATFSPGIGNFVRGLLKDQRDGGITEREVPHEFVGRSFSELSEFFRKESRDILIGVMSRVESPGLEDMLSSDSSAIDAFIKMAFEKSGKKIPGGKKTGLETHLNPPDEYVIQSTDTVIAIPWQGE